MRVLCVGRHMYISDHLVRRFGETGADCEPAVGIAAASIAAREFEPHVLVVEGALLNPRVLDDLSRDRALGNVPIIAVSMSRTTERCRPPELNGIAGVIYLPEISADDARTLLASACRPRGVDMPAGTGVPAARVAALR